jgi:hypothetical protein
MYHPKWVGSNHIYQSADNLCSTAVLAGLMRIINDPDILSVNVVLVSLWLRSNPDEATGEDEGNTVIRICTQGQDTNDTVSVRIGFQRHFQCTTSSVLPTISLHRLICRSLGRRLGSLTKISSKDRTSRTLPIQMLVKSPNSGGSNKNCRIRLSHPVEGYVMYIYT